MTDAATLLRLAEAVLSWDGFPLRLEAEIGLALEVFPELTGRPDGFRIEIEDVRSNYANVAVRNQHGGSVVYSVQPLAYLSSVDAALTVVPPEHTVHLSDWEYDSLRAKGPWMAIVLPTNTRGLGSRFSFVNRCQHAPCPARALLCAALRARAYQLIPPPSAEETKQ